VSDQRVWRKVNKRWMTFEDDEGKIVYSVDS